MVVCLVMFMSVYFSIGYMANNGFIDARSLIVQGKDGRFSIDARSLIVQGKDGRFSDVRELGEASTRIIGSASVLRRLLAWRLVPHLVVGSLVFGKGLNTWDWAFDEFRRLQPEKIREILESIGGSLGDRGIGAVLDPGSTVAAAIVEVGLIGLIGLIGMWAFIFRRVGKSWLENSANNTDGHDILIIITGGCVGLLLIGLTRNFLYLNYLWYASGFLIGLTESQQLPA